MANDPPTNRHDVEHLLGVGTEGPQGTTAGRARTGAGHRFVDDLEARQMRRQRPDRWRAIDGGPPSPIITNDGSGCGHEFFKHQLELCDLAGQLLARLAKRHALQPGDLDLQHIDEQIARRNIGAGTGKDGIALGQKRFQRSDPLVPIGSGDACVRHWNLLADQRRNHQDNPRKSG
jgi:hypothetical protein